MVMKRVFILFLCLLKISFSGAQFLSATGAGNGVLLETKYSSVEGSPYLYSDWKNGSVKDRNGVLSENLMIKYDSYRDEVQFLKDGRTFVIEPANASEFHFTILDENSNAIERLTFKNGFTIDGFTLLNYFQVLYEGKITYLKKIKANYLEENVTSYGTNEQVKKFVRTELEFMIRDGKVLLIGRNRKDFLSNFSDQESQIKSFIKTNKLSIKNDKDLAEILSRIDELSVESN